MGVEITLEITSSGLMFFNSLGIYYSFTIYIYIGFTANDIFFGLSLTLLLILGTGGTTPIPLLVLVKLPLTSLLDRFTLWASNVLTYVLLSIACEGDLKDAIQVVWTRLP
jgi:hypothetical protein